MKRIICLALVFAILLQAALPAVDLSAEEGAGGSPAGYHFSDGVVGSDVTGKITIKKVDLWTGYNQIYIDGALVSEENNLIGHWDEVTFYYEWVITPQNMIGINPKDYFTIPSPSLEKFMGKGTVIDEEYDIKGDNDSIIGKFKIDPTGKIIAKLGDAIQNSSEIKKGYFKVTLSLISKEFNARVDVANTEQAPKGVIVFEHYKPNVQPLDTEPMEPEEDISKEAFKEIFEKSTTEKIPALQWEISVNKEQQRSFINTGNFVEKKKVWVEDEFLLNDAFYLYDKKLEILPRMYALDENGIMTTAVALWNDSITGTVHIANDGESYEDFKARIRPKMKPYDAAVYPSREQAERDRANLARFQAAGNQTEIDKIFHNHANKLRVLVFLGDLTKDREYYRDSILNFGEVKGYLDSLLNDDQSISPQRYQWMLKKYTTWDETKSDADNLQTAKLRPVLFYSIHFMTTHPIQGVVSNKAKLQSENSAEIDFLAQASSVRAEGGASLSELTRIIINKKWVGKQGENDITFTITGDDTHAVVSDPSDPAGKKLMLQPKEPSKYTVVLRPGESNVLIPKAQANKEVIRDSNPTEKDVVPIVYTLKEEMTAADRAAYESKIQKKGNIFEVTNTNKEKIRLTIHKKWFENKLPRNHNGSVNVSIYDKRDTERKYPVKVNDKVSLPVVFNQNTQVGTLEVELPKYHTGDKFDINVPVEYVVAEAEDNAYSPDPKVEYGGTIDHPVITLTNSPNTEFIIKKVWQTTSGKPKPFAVINIKKGNKVEKVFRTNQDKQESFFLPLYDKNGIKNVYTVEEEALEGYSSHKEENITEGIQSYQFTNRDLQNLKITKIWKNGTVVAGRPVNLTLVYGKGNAPAFDEEYMDINTSITATYNNGREVAAPRENTGGKVKFTLPGDSVDGVLTIKGLPYADKLGTPLFFSVREDKVPGFLSYIAPKGTKHQEKTLYNLASKTLTLRKQWVMSDQSKKTDVELWLSNNGVAFSSDIAQLIRKENPNVAVEANKIKVTIPKETEVLTLTVPAFDLTGHAILYKAEEEQLPGFYPPQYDDTQADTIIVKNISNEITSIKVKKVWRHPVGSAEKNVTIALRPVQNPEKSVMLPKAGLTGDARWEHTFTGLPKYDKVSGEVISYTVEETGKPDGYNVSDGREADKLLVINTIEGNIGITLTKKWLGEVKANNVTVGVFQNGANTAFLRAVLSPKATDTDPKIWTDNITFANLPQYDGNGAPYLYEVKELFIGTIPVVDDETADYKAIVKMVGNSAEIINYNKEKVEVPFTKIWVGKPAAQVVFHLKEDGNPTTKSVILTAADVVAATLTDEFENMVSWAGKFHDLPKFSEADGHEIVYTVEEETIAGYHSTRQGNTFTNTYIPPLEPFIPVAEKPAPP
ncbi:MAG: Cna B-type domain-containing protein, partial [Eubacteriales bacterium]|nr:Cna B-type domain-containing protein [Eubacteriales bacterium]